MGASHSLPSKEEMGEAPVLVKFREFVADPNVNASVAAVQALTEVLRHSKATTMMEVQRELKEASELLAREHTLRSLTISSGCELFMKFVTRTFLDIPDFDECKRNLIQRGERFKKMTVMSRLRIANHAETFITDDCTILVHGFSRVLVAILQSAAFRNRRFRVIVTESQPDCAGHRMLQELARIQVPTVHIADSAVAHYLSQVDMVFVGAEAVVENGGIINKIGTYQIAIIAHSFNKPFYVAAESYKFTRIYPLNQQDLPFSDLPTNPDPASAIPSSTEMWNSGSDYTPPQFIRLLFSDLGVLTPSAVSDELIKLYN